ncbi:MAG: hypothetical protein ACK5OX_18370 [Desertimonas sp.]
MSILPSIEMPAFELPKIELPTAELAKLVDTARNMAYLGIGLRAVAAERATAMREEFVEQATSSVGEQRERFDTSIAAARARLEDLRDQLQLRFADVQDRYDDALAQIDAAIVSFNEKLPEPAQKVADKMHSTARTAREQLRDRISAAA